MDFSNGFWLDNYTFICPCRYIGDTFLWCKITLAVPKDKDGGIPFDHVTRKYFDIEIINPRNFKWNGHTLDILAERYENNNEMD